MGNAGNLEHTSKMPVLLIVLATVSVVTCYLIARSRSADCRFWILMGLVLGPLAIPFVFFARPKKRKE